jgi:hypothetical protein
VEGKGGFNKLVQKVRVGGPTVLYHGALAASAATFVGHYPWCVGVWGVGVWGVGVDAGGSIALGVPCPAVTLPVLTTRTAITHGCLRAWPVQSYQLAEPPPFCTAVLPAGSLCTTA